MTRPLRTGVYRLYVRSTGGSRSAGDVPMVLSRAAAAGLPATFETATVTITLSRRGRAQVSVDVAAPVRDALLTRSAQIALAARHGRSPRALEDAVFYHIDLGGGSADSGLAIHQELCRRGASLRTYWGVEDLGVPVPDGAIAVIKRSEQWYAKLNTSRYIVNNYGGILGFTKDPAQRYLQTWHGTPLKMIGVSEARRNKAPRARLKQMAKEAGDWDAFTSPSPYFTSLLASELLYHGAALELGYPRNDRLVTASRAERERLRAALGIAPRTTAVLYAPTYRERRRRGWRAPLFEGLDLPSLLCRLGQIGACCCAGTASMRATTTWIAAPIG